MCTRVKADVTPRETTVTTIQDRARLGSERSDVTGLTRKSPPRPRLKIIPHRASLIFTQHSLLSLFPAAHLSSIPILLVNDVPRCPFYLSNFRLSVIRFLWTMAVFETRHLSPLFATRWMEIGLAVTQLELGLMDVRLLSSSHKRTSSDYLTLKYGRRKRAGMNREATSWHEEN